MFNMILKEMKDAGNFGKQPKGKSFQYLN